MPKWPVYFAYLLICSAESEIGPSHVAHHSQQTTLSLHLLPKQQARLGLALLQSARYRGLATRKLLVGKCLRSLFLGLLAFAKGHAVDLIYRRH